MRCIKEQYLNKEGQIVAGQSVGHWRCPKHDCLARWGGASDWAGRILLIPNGGDDKKSEVYFVGCVSAARNTMLTALNSGELLKERRDGPLVT